MNTKELRDILDSVLSAASFRRRGDTWYRANEDTISVLNLQKSQWGGQFYVNLGVYLRPLGRTTDPREYQCHIRARLGGIAGGAAQRLERALNLESADLTSSEREEILRDGLLGAALPFFDQRSTIPKLRELSERGELEKGLLMLTAVGRDYIRSFESP